MLLKRNVEWEISRGNFVQIGPALGLENRKLWRKEEKEEESFTFETNAYKSWREIPDYKKEAIPI